MKKLTRRNILQIMIPLTVLISLAGCVTPVNPDFDNSKPHHRADGFDNRYLDRMQRPSFFKWLFSRRSEKRPVFTGRIEGVAPDIALIKSESVEPRVTWVGHATILLQIDGVNILTDPMWSDRASPVSFIGPKRHQPPGIPFEQLPHIDLVLISHNHFDHLDEETVQRLMNQAGGPPKFIVPLGVNYWFRDEIDGSVIEGDRQNVRALDWDQSIEFMGKSAPIKIEFLAVQHWSARTLNNPYATLWGSYAVMHPRFKFWFSGDLGYSKDTVDIGEKIGGFDMAAIAIGSYDPANINKQSHVHPSDAVKVFKEIRTKQAFGIHWGTFGFRNEPLDEAPKLLAKAREEAGLAEEQFFVLRHGQTFVIKKDK